jgi:hypothetical protein
MPLPGGGVLEVRWERAGDGVEWTGRPSRAVELRHGGDVHRLAAGEALGLVVPP